MLVKDYDGILSRHRDVVAVGALHVLVSEENDRRANRYDEWCEPRCRYRIDCRGNTLGD